MTTSQKIDPNKPFWFVFSKIDHHLDRFEPFVNKKYWKYFEEEVKENTRGQYLKYLHEMQVGDRIAMYESSSETPDEFKQKHNIDIDLSSISYLVIKAIGEITEPCKDNKTIRVCWEKVNDHRRWYSYAQNGQIWRVCPKNNDYWGENLIEFTFYGKDQDLNKLYHKVCSKSGIEHIIKKNDMISFWPYTPDNKSDSVAASDAGGNFLLDHGRCLAEAGEVVI